MGGGRNESGGRSAWPLAAPLFGWLAGCALQLQQPALWPMPWMWACAGVGLALWVAALRWRAHAAAAAALGLAGALALGFATTALRADARLAEALAPALEGQDLELVGRVARLPHQGLAGTRFVFEVEAATHRGEPVRVPRRVSLGWFRGPDDDALLLGPLAELRAGQRWRLPVRLRQPHGALNPHGFDLELWLFEQGIRATGYVRSRAGQAAVMLDADAGHPVERARQTVREAIALRVPDAAAAGVLAALAVGDQAAIEREDWELFRVTGVAHLMSISGLHVTMFAWLAGAAIGAAWRRSERLALAWPAPLAARWGGLAAAALYALFAGWGVPAQRTVAMLAALAWMSSAGLRWPLQGVLLAAAALVAALDPWALLQPGFWLSFVAVALLAASEPVRAAATPVSGGWARALSALRRGLATQAVATVGLAPLSLLFFQQVSVVGFAANLVAIPLVTLLVTPLALLGVLVPPLWSVAAAAVQGLSAFLGVLAAAPVAVWHAAAPPAWAVAAGVLGALLAVLPLPGRLRVLALPLLLPMLAPAVPRPPHGAFEAVVLDIGQGTAVLVRTRTHLLVYDTGPQFSPESDAGQRMLVPLLRARGEPGVDLLVLSHRDSDHVGGAASLLAALPVRELTSSLADDHPLRARGVPHRRCDAGQRWQWDGVTFEVLHPLADDHGRTARSNALSCVLRVQAASAANGAGGVSLLLAGDIEAAQEAALLAREGARLRSELLLVPHHGSRTSSTAAFIDAVAPRVALVQAAYRSRFGHPAPDVVGRYAERGIEVVRSARCGAWTLPTDGAGWCLREAARRYWHHPGR